MATLALAQATIAGTDPGLQAAAGGGDKIAPGDRTALLVVNGSGGSLTVTIAVPGNTRWGQAQPDVAVAVPAGETRIIGPLPSALAADSDGLVAITYSGVTSLEVAAITI